MVDVFPAIFPASIDVAPYSPIAALKGDNTTADELEAAKKFIAYLQTDEAMSVFEKYHFTVNE